MRAMGLILVFHEEQRATTYMLLVKLSETWSILKFIQSCGPQNAIIFYTCICQSEVS